MRVLFPREHGAYGQLSVPLLTALIVAGPSRAGLLVAGTVIAGFLAHEPVSVLVGSRGPRARRESGRLARGQLAVCAALGAAAAAGAVAVCDPSVRWSLLVPFPFAAIVAAATIVRRDKTSAAEIAAALALAASAVPVAMSGGEPMVVAASIALVFGLLFVASTLAVHVVILGVRGGGDHAAARRSRVAGFVVGAGGATALAAASVTGLIPAGAALAALPGAATALVVAARPPSPARLRTLGWLLMAVSVVTAAMLVATL